MSRGAGDELYVGYRRRAPAGLARFAARTAALLLAAGPALAALLAGRQAPFDPGVFELGRLRSFEGVIRASPYPFLEAGDSASGYDLVAPGKFGAQREVEGFDGSRARLSGSLIYRDEQRMIEVASGSAAPVAGEAPPAAAGEDLGLYRLVGEIVDAKCYLGVMKPGRTKPHRGCAVRCLSGGIPPLLVVEDRSGATLELLLVDAEGGPVGRRLLDRVAEPVEVTGRVRRTGGRLVLAADPAAVRRLE